MRDYAVNDGDELRLGNITMRVILVPEVAEEEEAVGDIEA
jgi:hypothetical protein